MNTPSQKSKQGFPWPFHPWAYFLIFTLSNTLLAYGAFSFKVKLAIGLFGILLPFLSALRAPLFFSPRKPFELFAPPPWGWVLLLLLGVFLRFYRLTTFLDFPLYDEIINALYAIRLNEHWTWNPFLGGTLLSFHIWLLSLVFKIFGVSLFSLWVLPALLSLSSVLFFYAAARRFFSRSVSFCLFFFLSAGFWPVFIGRFSHQAVLMIFWESVAFFALGALLKNPPPLRSGKGFLFLGAWVGLGFYTYFAWPLVAALIVMTLFLSKTQPAPLLKNKKIWFCAALAAAILPEASAALRQDYGAYLSSLFAFHRNPQNAGGWNPFQNIHYFSSFFWEGWRKNFAYNPMWGGFLNPALASLFFMGLLGLFQNRNLAFTRWLFAAFAILFFPILLANNTNWFHVVALLPLFLLTASLGVHVLYSNLKKPLAKTSLLALALVSMGLDGINMEKTRAYINLSHPSAELGQTYRILEKESRERGPGLIFSDLWLKPWPPFLGFATTPFNILRWKNSDLEKGSWAALVTNVNNQPFLKKRFPDGKAYWISKNHPPPDGGIMLWIMPASPDRLPVFKRWQEASLSLRPFLDQYAMVGPNEVEHYEPLITALAECYPSFRGDPFLESTFWEATSDIQLRETMWLHKDSLVPCFQALEQALKRGYPSANLYYQWGALAAMSGKGEQAARAFQKAAQAPIDLTDAEKFTETLLNRKGKAAP